MSDLVQEMESIGFIWNDSKKEYRRVYSDFELVCDHICNEFNARAYILYAVGNFQYIQLKTGTIEEIKAVVDALNPTE